MNILVRTKECKRCGHLSIFYGKYGKKKCPSCKSRKSMVIVK